jgi:hypothetical protein
LRDQKLHHSLPLVSAYSVLSNITPTNEQLKKQRSRLDATTHEPLFTNINKDFK